MIELPENAKSIGSDSKRFAAFVSRNGDTAMVYIFERRGVYGIAFDACVAAYETLSNGATNSARKEIKRLSKLDVIDHLHF